MPHDDGPEGTPVAAADAAPPAPRKRATIYDIAQLAGVDPSTVSRALSKPNRINEKTVQKVREAAEKLQYRVNPAARTLQTGRSGMIGLVLADITNPVFFDIVRGAERELARYGYMLVLAEFDESDERELVTAQRLLPSVDGLVLATSRLDDATIRALGSEKGVVVVNRPVDGVSSVVVDVEPGVRDAVAHLAGLGHREIAYLPGPSRAWISGRRWQAIEDACAAAGITAVRLPDALPVLEGGAAAAPALLAGTATAVITYNDLQAMGLIQELRAGGQSVPDALSVIGFDNIFGANLTSPGLTSIGAPHMDVGGGAARTLLASLGEQIPAADDALSTSLVVRGSTGPAASA